MGVVAFNTYDFVQDLKDAGMDEGHAAAISAGILKAHEIADLATKADVKAEAAVLRADLRELQLQTKTDLQELRSEMKADMQELRSETKADLRELELRMTIKLGSMMIVAVGILTAVIKFL